MIDRLRDIDSYKYLEDSLTLTDREKKLVKVFSKWLPDQIVDCHTHCNLRDHVQEVDEEMYHQMISTFQGFSLEDSHRVEEIFFVGKNLKTLRFPFPFRGIDMKAANDYLLTNVKDPDKVALCGIPNDVDYTISMLRTGRFAALKMYDQQFNPLLSKFTNIFHQNFRVSRKLGVPIILHLPKTITLCKNQH